MNSRNAKICAVLVFTAACGPSESDTDGLGLLFSAEDSQASISINPQSPDDPIGASIELAFGLDNAGIGEAAEVSLDALQLRSGEVAVDLTEVSLSSTTISSDVVYTQVYATIGGPTNADAAELCETSMDATLRVEASLDNGAKVSGELPIDLSCEEDRRRPDLIELVGEPPPANRPCRITADELTVEFGYNADGRVSIKDERFEGELIERKVYIYEGEDVVETFDLAPDGTVDGKRTFTYEAGVLVSTTSTVLTGPEETVEYQSDETSITGDGVTFSSEGKTVTSTQGTATLVVEFAEAPDLSKFIAYPREETAMRWGAIQQTLSSPNGEVLTEYAYQNGRIVRTDQTVGGVTGSSIWEYTCD